jgi:nucleotide-binding universal stress UspA family protein
MLAHLPFLNPTGGISSQGKEYLVFEKILAPLDGAPVSETGLTWAHSAASHLGASLQLLRIVDTTHHEANGHVADAEEYLKTLHDRISTTGVPVTSEVAVGSLSEEIVSRSAAAGLTVMTYHTSRWQFGGALDLLLKDMVTPVVIVRGHEGQAPPEFKCEKILAPIGESAKSKEALPAAIELCGLLNATLVLCHVVTPIPGAYDKRNPPPEIARAIEDDVMVGEQIVLSLDMDLRKHGINPETTVRVGEPAREIIAAAREVGAGLIAMSSRRSDSMSRILASVAMGVVQASPIPCMLVRPAPAATE